MRNFRPADMTAQRFKCLIDVYNRWIFRGIPGHFLSNHTDLPVNSQANFKEWGNRGTLAHVGIQQSSAGPLLILIT